MFELDSDWKLELRGKAAGFSVELSLPWNDVTKSHWKRFWINCFYYLNVYTYLLLVIRWKAEKATWWTAFAPPQQAAEGLQQAVGLGADPLLTCANMKAPSVLLFFFKSGQNCRHVFVLRRSFVKLPLKKGKEGGEKSFWVIYSERKQTKPGHRSRALTLL